VKIAFAAVHVELNAAAQGDDGIVELFEAVQHGPEVDEGAGAGGVQLGHLLEVADSFEAGLRGGNKQ